MIDIDRFPKLQGLVRLLDNRIESKKKLHKLIYLLQQAGEDFDYRYVYHSYGVFSPELASDLDVAVEDSVLRVEKSVFDKTTRYDITCPDNAVHAGDPSDIGHATELAKKLGKREPQFLEALSTVVYLRNSFYEGERLKKKLGELKPKLESHFENAYTVARDEFNVNV